MRCIGAGNLIGGGGGGGGGGIIGQWPSTATCSTQHTAEAHTQVQWVGLHRPGPEPGRPAVCTPPLLPQPLPVWRWQPRPSPAAPTLQLPRGALWRLQPAGPQSAATHANMGHACWVRRGAQPHTRDTHLRTRHSTMSTHTNPSKAHPCVCRSPEQLGAQTAPGALPLPLPLPPPPHTHLATQGRLSCPTPLLGNALHQHQGFLHCGL
jgi:hypothetical protein